MVAEVRLRLTKAVIQMTHPETIKLPIVLACLVDKT